jgi:hypothetical protein
MVYLNKVKVAMFIMLGMLLITNANAANSVPFNGTLRQVNEAGYSITISGDGQRHILSIADIERLPLHTTNFAFGDINGLRGDFVGVKLIDLLNYVGITKFNQSWL